MYNSMIEWYLDNFEYVELRGEMRNSSFMDEVSSMGELIENVRGTLSIIWNIPKPHSWVWDQIIKNLEEWIRVLDGLKSNGVDVTPWIRSVDYLRVINRDNIIEFPIGVHQYAIDQVRQIGGGLIEGLNVEEYAPCNLLSAKQMGIVRRMLREGASPEKLMATRMSF